MDAALVRERLIAMLSTLFGLLAVLLACVGVYGLLAFAVVRRTGEIGIRIALGAARGDVLWMILRDALLLASAGVAIGLPAAVVVGRVASSRIPGLLFGLQTADFTTLAAAATLLPIVAMLAAYVPARRASHVDPMAALRNE
jgi:ABC-type antimicrobial peptide transport system permease subunit